MMGRPRKVCVIGLDAPLPRRMLEHAQAGLLPNFANLVETGVRAESGLVPHPTITPPHWTTISTGSWPGTHGITDYNVFYPGDDLLTTHQGFGRDDCLIENIWEAAEKGGKKSIVYNFPASWPPRLANGIVVGGNSNHVNDWRTDKRGSTGGFFTTSADQTFSTVAHGRGVLPMELAPATGWGNAPQSQGKRDLQATLDVPFLRSAYEMAPTTWHLLVQDTRGRGYDQVVFSPTKDARDAFAVLAPGQWSKKITTVVSAKNGVQKSGSFHAKLMKLTPDAADCRLFTTGGATYRSASAASRTARWQAPCAVPLGARASCPSCPRRPLRWEGGVTPPFPPDALVAALPR